LKIETSDFLLLHRNFTLVAELVDLPAGRQARKVEGLVSIIKFIKNKQLLFSSIAKPFDCTRNY
jgi:hypothetical protein